MDGAARLLGEGVMGFLSGLLGRDDEDVLSVPAMDGVFKPNTLLDAAERVLELPGTDNLCAGPDRIYCSSADVLFGVDAEAGHAEPIRRFGGPVTMVAASASGRLAVGAEGTGLELFEKGAWRRLDLPADCASCVTAGVFAGDDDLYLAIGSRRHRASAWKRDLMSRGSTGALVRCRVSSGSHGFLEEDLAFPYGLAVIAEGRLAVSESWRHRILTIRMQRNSAPEVAIADLPAYPARLAPASDGGFWLALFAPRRQLTEFVLGEDDYRREMMATIPPEAWIGPDFSDHGGEEHPLQAGSVRQMGIMKPWAPSRSYGLVVRLDRDLKPLASFHSRADGRMHGIASVVEFGGRLYAASRGNGTLLRLDIGSGASR
jgi:hypothetical protein